MGGERGDGGMGKQRGRRTGAAKTGAHAEAAAARAAATGSAAGADAVVEEALDEPVAVSVGREARRRERPAQLVVRHAVELVGRVGRRAPCVERQRQGGVGVGAGARRGREAWDGARRRGADRPSTYA